ncbi:MBL fold metallo-hydrolase [Phenylobacterium sp.]|uniref:MBL fold metallo-hydrolase n=1 Tax=Phenylobacterium sp. TaxID=1871053 RepID=UPI002FC581E9
MIPFVRDMAFDYGCAQQVTPLIRRVVAPNAGPFTHTGTGAHIVGHGQVAVIDPGPNLDSHLEAILRATSGETITHIFVTHGHLDHSPLARPLAELTGATIFAGPPRRLSAHGDDRLEAGDDLTFRPDVELIDRALFSRRGWTIEAMATPGHTSDHYAFALWEENALFPGDCVMGWSTSVVSPPDGDMADYLASLEKIRARRFDLLLPAHGPPIDDVGPFLDAYIGHRLVRERQILEALRRMDVATVRLLVEEVYAGLDRRLRPAAAHSVLSHLIKLADEGLVETSGPIAFGTVFRPARARRAA